MNTISNLSNGLLTDSIDEQLKPYLFDVESRKAGYETAPYTLFPMTTLTDTERYQAIVRKDKDKLISIMPSTYKLVSNAEVVLPVLEFLDNFDNKWYIDESHSFVEDGRMRLQITFPDLIVNDGESNIALSLYLHNSYNGVEGVRGFWGGIRAICYNGMVFGELLGSFYHRHTSGINLDRLKMQVEDTTMKLPVIQERIDILQSINTNSEQLKDIEKKMGKKVSKYVEDNFLMTDSQYVLLNVITDYISHCMEKRLQASYQMRLSKLFNI